MISLEGNLVGAIPQGVPSPEMEDPGTRLGNDPVACLFHAQAEVDIAVHGREGFIEAAQFAEDATGNQQSAAADRLGIVAPRNQRIVGRPVLVRMGAVELGIGDAEFADGTRPGVEQH